MTAPALRLIAFVSLLLSLPPLESGEFAPGSHRFEFELDGHQRRYLAHRPSGVAASEALPVVFSFHGGGGRGELDARATTWIDKAEAEGFLVVFPEGTAADPDRPARFVGNPQSWNDGSDRGGIGAVDRGIDDVAFFDSLLDDLAGRTSLDLQRVYLTGFSNGASMSFRLARERSERIAAVAPVAGADWLPQVEPARPVPIFYITGDSDPLNPVEGGEIHIGRRSYGTKPPVEETVADWGRLHGLGEAEEGEEGLSRINTYRRPGGPPLVVLRIVQGHGHHWPGSPSLLPAALTGPNVADFDAVDAIWEFFQAHRLED